MLECVKVQLSNLKKAVSDNVDLHRFSHASIRQMPYSLLVVAKITDQGQFKGGEWKGDGPQ